MRNPAIIAVDLDDCVFENFMNNLLILYNEKYQDILSLEDFTDYNVKKFIKPECKNIFQEFVNDEFINNLFISDDAIKFLTWANNYGNLIFITAGHPYTMKSRHDTLSKYLPFYSANNLWMGQNKKLLNCDYLIDDCIANLEGNIATTICMNRPWNKAGYADYRVDNFAQARKIIETEERKREHELQDFI